LLTKIVHSIGFCLKKNKNSTHVCCDSAKFSAKLAYTKDVRQFEIFFFRQKSRTQRPFSEKKSIVHINRFEGAILLNFSRIGVRKRRAPFSFENFFRQNPGRKRVFPTFFFFLHINGKKSSKTFFRENVTHKGDFPTGVRKRLFWIFSRFLHLFFSKQYT